MPRQSHRKNLSLKWLELFQICALMDSLQAASVETGLTVSTISHHLRSLGDHLGVDLFDHGRRPMVLTPKGKVFLRIIDDALHAIRRAQAEASAGNIAEASYLRLGTIEEFDSDIIPELAVFLSNSMPRRDFLYQTESSHSLIEMLRNRQLDLGITACPTERLRDLIDRPLLRDPFTVVLPVSPEGSLSEIVEGRTELPFLRFSGNLIIARQIEPQLGRMGVSSPHSFECSNSQTLSAMVATGAGWTITTPLPFARARRFQSWIRMHRFPGMGFSRELAIVTTPDCSRSIVDLIDRKIRALVDEYAIRPLLETAPWLKANFTLIE